MTLDVSDDLWDEVDCCIKEIEWFATRKKDLGDTTDKKDMTWADMLMSDVEDLRRALVKVQQGYASDAAAERKP